LTPPTTARRSVAGAIVLVGLVAALVAAWAIVAHDVGEGPVVIEFTARHGLHRGEVREVSVLVGGFALTGIGVWLVRSSR
jgi:hypothetical protein